MKVLAPVICYGIFDFTNVDVFPWGRETLRDVITGKELTVDFNGEQISISNLYASHQLVPTQLLLLSEAVMALVAQAGGSSASIGGPNKHSLEECLLTTPTNFWKLVSDKRKQIDLLEAHDSLKGVLLPGLATAPDPESLYTMANLRHMLDRMDLVCLPSFKEYNTINYKPLQFEIATRSDVTGARGKCYVLHVNRFAKSDWLTLCTTIYISYVYRLTVHGSECLFV